jgi:hypothetical protein
MCMQFVHCSVIQEQNWNYILMIFFVFSVPISIWVGIYRYLYTAECRGYVQRWQHQVGHGISPRARYFFIPHKPFKMHILVFCFSGHDCPDCDTINFCRFRAKLQRYILPLSPLCPFVSCYRVNFTLKPLPPPQFSEWSKDVTSVQKMEAACSCEILVSSYKKQRSQLGPVL